MPVQPVRHISVAISRPVEEVYAFLADPRNMPRWASGLGLLALKAHLECSAQGGTGGASDRAGG